MFFLRRPTPAQAQAFLEAQRLAGYSYPEIGQTGDALLPAGYTHDRHVCRLGHGDACFARARSALQHWRMFETTWIRLLNPQAPWLEGETLVTEVAHLGVYSLIANRVVYTVDEPTRCGFAYGTLTGHAEQGEERFLVTLAEHGDVAFELLAFSRPRHPLAQLGAPIVRALQQRAAASYSAAMVRAVTGQG